MQLIARTPISIAINTALSVAVPINGNLLCMLEMPAAWTTANITFQSSGDGATYQNLYDEYGNEITIVTAVARNITLDPARLAGCKYLKFRSGTAAVPVNQTAARTFFINLWE